ncbi:MAG: TonB-dependent receptor [Bacteroidetes bacterium]|nr:MAG: TonB-dependent receptor [Bacteroidota bacterium]
MRTTINIVLLITMVIPPVPFVFASITQGKTSLSGKITDKETGEGIPGVSVYFPDMKTGTITKADGTYFIDNLPAAKVLIKAGMVGYASITETIDLSVTTVKDFVMEKSVTEITEVVITGLSQSSEQKRTPTPISVVPHEQLLQNGSSNIIDAISKEPGVSQVSTGPAISKPIIRGLGYNRVVVVNDGIRQEGHQWGDEHGIEIDEYSVNKVEILKGPASLAYGSDAMAGVVNIISFPTLPQGTIKGNLLGNYQTNNGMIGYSGNVAGNLNGFVSDIRFSRKQAHDYQNRYDRYVLGSKFKETDCSGIFGLNKSWGYSHLHLSSYHLITEITEGKRDSATGRFIKPFALNDSTAAGMIASGKDFTDTKIGFPHQNILHYKAVLNNSFVIKNSRLNLIVGWQQNHRKEFADILAPDAQELYFLMNTLHYDARFIFPEKNKYHISVGVNGMRQSSQNKGVEFLVPEYNLFDLGGFITLKRSWEKLDISGGVRFDTRSIESLYLLLDSIGKPIEDPQPGMTIKFAGFLANYANVSGSIGAAYQFSKVFFTKLNVSRGFRAPGIGELGSNGEHEGTFRYEIGDTKLKPETSLQFDLAFGLNSEHVTCEISVFSNSISHYIYTEKLNSVFGGDSILEASNQIPTFKFVQGNADLSGGEILIDIHPHPFHWLHFENSFCFVEAVKKNSTDSTKHLPFIPAPKFSTELKAEIEKIGSIFKNAYVMAGIDTYFKQNNFYSAHGTETETHGYTLVNFGMGTDVVNKKNKTICSFYVSANNLTDAAYQSHLSRLKYAEINYATGRAGVFNMGRNISVKLVIPFDIKKQKE